MSAKSKNLDVIVNSILEGEDIRDTLTKVFVNEKTYKSPEEFEGSKMWKYLDKTSFEMFKKVDHDTQYRRNTWAERPLEAVKDELEEYYFAIHNLESLDFKNVPDDVQKKLNKMLKSANRSYKRSLTKLKKNNSPEEVKDSFRPLHYTKKALKLLTNYFNLLGVKWDNVWPWYNTDQEPEVDSTASDFIESVNDYADWFFDLYENNLKDEVRKKIFNKRRSLSSIEEKRAFNKARKLV